MRLPVPVPEVFVHLSVNATRSNRDAWGDTPYAEGLARAIRQVPGCDAALLFRGEAPERRGAGDVVLRLVGPHLDEPVPGLPNLIWMISPPNLAPVAMLARHQAVFSASASLAARLTAAGVPVDYLPQATDPARFHPARRPEGAEALAVVFVGGHAPRVGRRLVLDAVRAGFEPQIWGPGWEDVVPARLIRGRRLDPDGLAAVYASARVVLNSHMANMALMGMMSNRSFDALCSGAHVLSDPVRGFAAPGLPELVQAGDDPGLPELARMLEGPAPDMTQRLALHDRVARSHGFAARAAAILDAARVLLAEGRTAPPAFAPRASGRAGALRLTDPAASAPTLRAAMEAAAQEMLAIARWLEHPDRPAPAPPEPAPGQGVIHPLMADLRRLQRIALEGRGAAPALPGAPSGTAERPAAAAGAAGDPSCPLAGPEGTRCAPPGGSSGPSARLPGPQDASGRAMPGDPPLLPAGPEGAGPVPRAGSSAGASCPPACEIADLAARARRVAEVLGDRGQPLSLRPEPGQFDALLARVLRNEPLWAHTPEGFHRDGQKVHLALRPRRDRPPMERPVGVFLHLFHDDLAPVFAAHLARIGSAVRLYVSTDTADKAERIAASLPQAEIRVLENRGRDIWPKFYGFGEAHGAHDVVLHLHGKKSPHSGRLDAWLDHILACLLGSEAEVNRILSLFCSVPRLGIVCPVTFRSVLSAAHWGANADIARELAGRMGLEGALPGNDTLRFPAGSMFWARTAALRPLLDLRLTPGHFPPEAGQVDGTLAHAIERMAGVCCRATGHHILPVSGGGRVLHARHSRRFTTNRELREALESGVFDG